MTRHWVLPMIIALMIVGMSGLAGCGDEEPTPSGPSAQEGSLVIEDEVLGTGPAARIGDTVTVHYTGWLADGTKFDSSLDRGQPFTFVLGQHEVITGWDLGVAGMKAGGVRKLTIPPRLGYGDQGSGDVIPAGSTLVFEIELIRID